MSAFDEMLDREIDRNYYDGDNDCINWRNYGCSITGEKECTQCFNYNKQEQENV